MMQVFDALEKKPERYLTEIWRKNEKQFRYCDTRGIVQKVMPVCYEIKIWDSAYTATNPAWNKWIESENEGSEHGTTGARER